MRLIDADKLHFSPRYAQADLDSAKLVPVYAVDQREIDEAPTVEAEPVVYAHWEKSEYRGFVRCSACKDAYIDEDWLTSSKWGGCPNCRAKMDLAPPEGGQP